MNTHGTGTDLGAGDASALYGGLSIWIRDIEDLSGNSTLVSRAFDDGLAEPISPGTYGNRRRCASEFLRGHARGRQRDGRADHQYVRHERSERAPSAYAHSSGNACFVIPTALRRRAKATDHRRA